MKTVLEAYRILGLPAGAPARTVKQAYRILVKQWHPDRFANQPVRRAEAEEKIKQINLAFEQIREHGERVALALRVQQLRKQAAPPAPPPAVQRPDRKRGKRGATPHPNRFVSPPPVCPKPRPADSTRGWPAKRMIVVTFAASLAVGVLFAALLPLRPDRPRAIPQSVASMFPNEGAPGAILVDSVLPQSESRDFDSVAEQPATMSSPLVSSVEPNRPPLIPISEFQGAVVVSRRDSVVTRWEAEPGIPSPELVKGLEALERMELAREDRSAAQLEEAVRADLGRKYFTIASRCLAEGTPDYESAARYFQLSAQHGNSEAMKNLGFLYASGKGVSKDMSIAQSWFRKSAQLGDAAAGTMGVLLGLASVPEPASSTKD